MGEGVDSHGPAPPTNKRRIKVRVSLFFDGTGNNRVNTQYREPHPRRYGWWSLQYPFLTGSYQNDLSNVARLAENVRTDAPGYDAFIRVYTEGIGTTDNRPDDVPGLAFGTGLSGVHRKVTRGLSQALNLLGRRFTPERFILERVAVDASGFSRGAAAARHCVHRVLSDSRAHLKLQLEGLGYEVGRVEVLAVGLFATVSSHGRNYDDDVADLNLDAIRQAAAVYQLAAAEEYRERFSLTTIASAGGNGRQVYLPGAHSDVGGGYLDGAGEDQTLLVGSAAHDVSQFLLARGWYRGDASGPELVCVPGRHGTYTPYGTAQCVPARLLARRATISRAYTFIPSGLMAEFLLEQGVPVRKAQLEAQYDPAGVPGRDRIVADARAGRASSPRHWEVAGDAELARLRHGYLHVSFSTSTGMGVRLTPAQRPYR